MKIFQMVSMTRCLPRLGSEERYDDSLRIIKKINRLYDVSAVTVPAYAQTTINARSYFEAEAEKERLEKRERERYCCFEVEVGDLYVRKH